MEQRRNSKNEIQCPECGHLADATSRCAHCGLRLEKRMELKLFRSVALAIAVGGLFLLNLHAKKRELPVISIGEISPRMNFSSVRVRGVLESDARRLDSGAVLYVVNDGTGTIAAFFNGEPGGKLPMAGSRVVISGSLSVGVGNELRMRVLSVEVIATASVFDSDISEFHLADITAEQKGARMTVAGRVSYVWKPKPGSKAPHKIILKDASGILDVVCWLKDVPEFEIGAEIEVTGTVDLYKEQLQLKVRKVEDFKPVEKDLGDPQSVNISVIKTDMEKRVVEVVGVLGEPRSIPGGVVYPLSDQSGTIPVVFWDRNISGEERDVLDEHVRIRVIAPVGLYKGIPQLVPEDVGGFQTLE
ncbi:MAG: OB-fold nucleic acid binding domain-containing protein [Kiritimatiellaceae bacterium]|nr:OB-fold nucleic acid binding domain-containing protein [Kiritimatiellaceae bacterium]